MWEKVQEWGWSLVLLTLGAVGTLLSRWISMLNKHEKQLAIIEYEQKARIAASNEMVKSITDMNTRLEVHRRESMDRIDALRRDLREDFKTLIEMHARQEERDVRRG